MGKFEEIYVGWKNYVFRNPEMENVAKKRLKICVDCKINKKSGITPYNTCRVCGCYISAKVRSKKSNCPLNKW